MRYTLALLFRSMFASAALAWVYPKYCPDCLQWKAPEQEARDARRALWRDDNPMPPWERRKK